jgi:HK97 family phage portal protein
MLRAIARVLEAGAELRGFPTIADLDNFMDWRAGFGGANNWAGANVSASTALGHDVFWACCVIRANTLGQLPLVTYRLLEDGQERARTHYLYNLLRRRVNSQMSAFRFKQLLEMWICIYGNAYAWLDINDRGQTVAIYPWHPSRVSVELEDFAGEKQVPFYYFRHDSGEKTRAHWSQMIHLRGPGTDGFFGLNPISTHCQTLGYGLAMREHGSRFFSNGASIRGLIRPKDGVTIDPKRLDEAKKNWHDAQGGLSNAHKTAFLNAALEFQPIAMSMKEADYVAIADMNGPQICRIMNVPPPKVAILGRATYANITQLDLEWLRDMMGPELTNWEDELNWSLLSEREAQSIKVEFLVNYLMRADIQTRAMYLKAALGGAPWMRQAEARSLENLYPPDTDDLPITNNAPQRQPPTSASGA